MTVRPPASCAKADSRKGGTLFAKLQEALLGYAMGRITAGACSLSVGISGC